MLASQLLQATTDGSQAPEITLVNTAPIQQRAPGRKRWRGSQKLLADGASSTAPAGLSFAPDRAAELTASRLVCRVRALAS